MIFRKLCFLSFIESNANPEFRLYPSFDILEDIGCWPHAYNT